MTYATDEDPIDPSWNDPLSLAQASWDPLFSARQRSRECVVRGTAVQEDVFGESVSSLPAYGLLFKHLKTMELIDQTLLSIFAFWTTVSPHDAFSSAHPNFRERKAHKHKQMCGIVAGLGGGQKLVYVFFFRVIPAGGEKHINKIPPQKSRENPVNILFIHFLYVTPSCAKLH